MTPYEVSFFLFLGGCMDYINHLEFYISSSELNKIRKCDDIYLKSAVLVRILFKDKKDKAGEPYIGHLFRVSSKMTTVKGMVAGLLHDVVEDIENIEFDDLLDIGIPEDVVDALRLVTKEPSMRRLTKVEKLIRYNREIDNIISSGNNLALELKIADMDDNFSRERLEKVSPEELAWFNMKYADNLKKLENEKEKRKIKC